MHLIDEQAKEAVAALLRIIAYHDRLARRAEEKDLEESWRYHETSRKDAEERLAVYEKRLAGRRCGRKSDTPAEAAEAGNYPDQGTAAVMVNVKKRRLVRVKGCSPPFAEGGSPTFKTLEPNAAGSAPDLDGRRLRSSI